MAEIESQIKQMEKYDIIEPSFSSWSAPLLLLVKKKLDTNRASQIPKFRIVVDFRALNKVTDELDRENIVILRGKRHVTGYTQK